MTTAASKMGNSSELDSVDFARYAFVFLSLFVFVIAFVFDENDKGAKTTVVERALQLQRGSVGRFLCVFVCLSFLLLVIVFVYAIDDNDLAKTTVETFVRRPRQLQRCSVGRAQVAPLTSKHQ